jgi:hypothetical protein
MELRETVEWVPRGTMGEGEFRSPSSETGPIHLGWANWRMSDLTQ